MKTGLGFEHVFEVGAAGAEGVRTLLLLHGTGGDERDLVEVGRSLDAGANLLSPRGKVLERAMPRFFRRLREGVFDEADLILRANELADFVGAASTAYGFDAANVWAVGFSNGANIAAGMMMLRPEVLRGAALWRGMVPLVPGKEPDLGGRRVLLTSGAMDGMVSEAERGRLAGMLRGYGAEVEAVVVPAGHGLVEEDLVVTKRWLGG